MTNIYCGNNSLSKELTSKQKRRGSRYDCFRKGVGIGLYQPLDKTYADKYKAIDKRRLYCGKARGLPTGYSIMGSPSMCLQHGVGVGKKLKAKKSKSRRKSKVKSRKYRKKSNMRPPPNRNILPPNNFCFDYRMSELTRYLGNKYVISCSHKEGDNSVEKTIIIKSRANITIAYIQGLFVHEDQESFISWLHVNPRYRGRIFAQYLILLFAKLSSLYGKTSITLDDDTDNARGYRENRTTRGQDENSIRPQGYPLRDLGNIYLKMGFRYKEDDDNEMIIDVNDILIRQRQILSKFIEKNKLN